MSWENKKDQLALGFMVVGGGAGVIIPHKHGQGLCCMNFFMLPKEGTTKLSYYFLQM